MDHLLLVFRLELTMGFVFWGLVSAWFVLPWLYKMSFSQALLVPLLIAVLRFHGMNFTVPGINAGLSPDFYNPAAYGDLAVCLLALMAAIFVRMKSKAGVILAWAYVVLGALDFANGFYLGETTDMPHHLGASWYLVIYEAPLEITTLVVLVRVLLKHPQKNALAAA